MEETSSMLLPTQRYAAAALFAFALHHSQIHHHPTTPPNNASVSDNLELWIHDNSGLLSPVFRFLGVDDQAWHGLRETITSSSQFKHHLGSRKVMQHVQKDWIKKLH